MSFKSVFEALEVKAWVSNNVLSFVFACVCAFGFVGFYQVFYQEDQVCLQFEFVRSSVNAMLKQFWRACGVSQLRSCHLLAKAPCGTCASATARIGKLHQKLRMSGRWWDMLIGSEYYDRLRDITLHWLLYSDICPFNCPFTLASQSHINLEAWEEQAERYHVQDVAEKLPERHGLHLLDRRELEELSASCSFAHLCFWIWTGLNHIEPVILNLG